MIALLLENATTTTLQDIVNVSGAITGGAGLAISILALYYATRTNVKLKLTVGANMIIVGNHVGDPEHYVSVSLYNRSGAPIFLERLTIGFGQGLMLIPMDPEHMQMQKAEIPHGGGHTIEFSQEDAHGAMAEHADKDGWIIIHGYAKDQANRIFRTRKYAYNTNTCILRERGVRRLLQRIKQMRE